MNKKREIVDRRKTTGERIFFILFFCVLFIWCAITMYMLFWAVSSGFKTNLEYIREPLKLPEKLQWGNFKIAMEKLNHNGVGFWGMLWNSIWLVVGSTFLGTLSIIITGYIFGQYEFKGKTFLISVLLLTMTLPIYGSLPASYKLTYDLGWNDSYLLLLQAIGGFNSSMLITYGFYRGVPKDYREAVKVDGGGNFTSFIHIGLPMGKSIYIAFFLLHFISGWNNYDTPILYLDTMPTLSSGLYYFQQEIVYEANNPAYFCGALLAMLPVLILFIAYSDKIMGKMYSGGLKM